MEKEAEFLFEISFEVCNKVGGIYTVVSSKAADTIAHYNENYLLVGPYYPTKAHGIFIEDAPPNGLKNIFQTLHNEGIKCHYGKWMIKGTPNVILIEFTDYAINKDKIKKELWDNFQIDSLYTEYHDFDEPVIWAYACGRLIEEYKKNTNKKVVAQFHEWLSGSGILYLKQKNVNVGTIFTTHATTLGRTISSSGQNLYENLENIKSDEEAIRLNVKAKHQLEKAAAKNCKVFTTVSEITAIEAEKILDRKVDVILPNGLDMEKFPTMEQLSIKHNLFKSKIKEFIIYNFFPYYTFDLDETLIYFIAGRHEFRDKGVDILIDSLGELNKKLKQEKSNKTIVVFFWIPGNVQGIKPEILENRRNYEDVSDSIKDEQINIQNRIVKALITKTKINENIIFDEELYADMQTKILRFKKNKNKPSITTHDLYDEEKDEIIIALNKNELTNNEADKVKIIYYPIYLTGADGLLDTNYYESMIGSNFGLFPSYYEPWGYTPLEAAGLGVPAVTTDLAGYGRFICSNCTQGKTTGIYVIKRMGKTYEQSKEELTKVMYEFSKLSPKERMNSKINAKKTAEVTDWNILIENYIIAHNKAMR